MFFDPKLRKIEPTIFLLNFAETKASDLRQNELMPADLIALDKLRNMLGADAESLTDAELSEYRDQLYQLSNVILDANDEFSGRNDLVENLLADCAKLHCKFDDEDCHGTEENDIGGNI